MPAPTTPVGPAQASVSLAKSMDPGIAKAVGVGFLATDAVDAPVTMVSADDPFPVTLGSGDTPVSGDWLTDAELRATPVLVGPGTQVPAAPSSFTSTTSAVMLAANANRTGAIIYVEPGSGDLHVLLGAGTASATNKTLTIEETGYYEIPPGVRSAITAIFGSAGTAYVTELT